MRKATSNMKNILRKYLGSTMLLFGAFALLANPVLGQCNEGDFVDACAVNLGDDYSYLRTFDAEEIESSTDYPYTGAFLFRKGINYVFTSCGVGENNAQIVVNLYNRTRKLVASTYNSETDKHYEKMLFKCNATAIFFVQTLTALDDNSCGITMLGFNAQ